jgi:predicted nucleotidyltransferase
MDSLLAFATKTICSARAVPAARAGCVLGSVARGGHDSLSDIDALVIVSAANGEVARAVRHCIPAKVEGHQIQLRIISRERLEEMRDTRTVYAAHVATEAKVAFDRGRDLRKLKRAFPPGSRVEEDAQKLRKRLALYEDLTWCNGHYLACFADLYAFGRAGAILALARDGTFEFGRSAPFVALSEAVPSLSAACATLAAFEPFYLRGRRDAYGDLPFPHRDAHDAALQAREACARILNSVP